MREIQHDSPECRGCHCVIDLGFCWCGQEKKGHEYEDHAFQPSGCQCDEPDAGNWR